MCYGASLPDLAEWSELAGLSLSGAADLNVQLRADRTQRATLALSASDIGAAAAGTPLVKLRRLTANGTVTVWHLKLASLRIGEVEVHDVDATVVPAGMPYVLLGNSFLTRFQMKRENETMILERRY